ncbi:MAG: hypothetical protein V1865_00765 [bacterium]
MVKKTKKKNKKIDQLAEYRKNIETEGKEREKDVKESLAQIYQDENGEIINVKAVDIKKKKHFGLLTALIYIAVFILIFYGIYFFINRNNDGSNIDFLIEADKEQIAGQEFFYTVSYQNLDRVGINNIQIKLDYPDGFIFLDSDPKPDKRNDVWEIDRLEPHRGGEIKIKGKMVNKVDSSNMILGEMYYYPDNFSSEFKEVADAESITTSLGINLEVIPPASLFVNEAETLIINFSASSSEELINNFKLEIIPTNPDNIKFISAKLDDGKEEIDLPQAEPWIWGIGNINQEEKSLKINFLAKERISSSETFKIRFLYQNDQLVKQDEFMMKTIEPLTPEDEELSAEDEAELNPVNTEASLDELLAMENTNLELKQNLEYYLFYEQDFEIEVVQNDLNLTMLINDQNHDLGADFGDRLEYSITYSNKGGSIMKNVIVMAVLEGPLDWNSLETTGERNENTIIWTPKNVPTLKSITPGASGRLNFQINIKDFNQTENQKTEIKGYAQFNTFTEDDAGQQAIAEIDNNLSNTILIKINSDLSLNEELRYYTEDNIPVGTGPLPPKVGETTTLKAYWRVNNSLHNLKNVQVSNDLPDYVQWNSKDMANVGSLRYDQYDHRVIWDINQVNIYDEAPEAEFSISLTPGSSDQDKILILLNKTSIIALDIETNEEIKQENKAKTTKLEDDEMIEHDGVVQGE